MKIAILTHPLFFNYGGIMQCYALSTYLKALGHDVIVIQRQPDRPNIIRRRFRRFLEIVCASRYAHIHKVDKAKNTFKFVTSNINYSKPIDNQRLMKRFCKDYAVDVVIVGSDQVWRADYAMRFGYNYFLDFVPSQVRKIAYAASFGLSEWQYTRQQTDAIKRYLTGFVAISVREREAVDLCKENLGLDVEQTIDPTLLLSSSDYDKICAPCQIDKPYVFIYWLGDLSQVEGLAKPYKDAGYEVVVVALREKIELMSVEHWLSYIKYAEVVITDSFHGCVFALLYKKRFKVLRNTSGGYGRIETLLSNLGLSEDMTSIDVSAIYAHSEQLLSKMQETSKMFLQKSLTR